MGQVLKFLPRRSGKTIRLINNLTERRNRVEKEDNIGDEFLSVVTHLEKILLYHGKTDKSHLVNTGFTFYRRHNAYCSQFVIAARRANWYDVKKHKNLELYYATQLEF